MNESSGGASRRKVGGVTSDGGRGAKPPKFGGPRPLYLRDTPFLSIEIRPF